MKHSLLALASLSLLGGCSVYDFGTDGAMTKVVGTDGSHVWALGGGTANDRVFQLASGGASEAQQFPGEALFTMAANAPDDLWVVGTAVHHYDGSAWTTIAMPSDPLVAIGNGWAVGVHGTVYRPGATFDVVAGPDPQIDLTGPGVIEANEWGDAPNDIWVTDGAHLFHYTTAWADVTPPSTVDPTQLQALTGTGPNDVWVSTFDGREFHYDGAAWSTATTPASDSLIIGMYEHTPSDIWAVGYSNVLLHYDGTSWTQQAVPPQLHCDGPDVNGNATLAACTNNISLDSVWGSGGNDVWVVGYLEEDPGGIPLLFHYDGTTWSDVQPVVNATVRAMTKPKLTYFDAPVSRGEECRLALHLAGIDFEDVRVPAPQWPALKPESPYGGMPIFELPGKAPLAHSNAILGLIGRRGGLHPTDDYEAARHEGMMQHVEDLRGVVGPTIRMAEAEKKAAREAIMAGYLPAWAAAAEKNILAEPFFGGAKISVVDLKLHMVVRWFNGGKVDHIPATVFAAYPKLTRIHDAVRDHEGVKRWYAKR